MKLEGGKLSYVKLKGGRENFFGETCAKNQSRATAARAEGRYTFFARLVEGDVAAHASKLPQSDLR